MNKIIKQIGTLFIIISVIAVSFFTLMPYFNIDHQKNNSQENQKNINGDTNYITPKNQSSQSKQDKINSAQSRIDILKKRLSFKGLIQDGDLHFENKEYTRALVKYLKVNKETPNDPSIINKIGNIYYSINRYDQAYKYYSQIKNYATLDQHRAIRSLFFSESLKLDNIKKIKSEINTFNISKTEKFYYNNSLTCTQNFHECRQAFQDYFKNRDNPSDAGSGEIVITDGIRFQELENIKQALDSYENFQYDDLSYKSALISGAYYENRLYPIAIATSEITLKESPDYRPLIKIIAKSYYDLGKYIEAKKFLIQYNGLGDKEPEISYFLGIVHQKLREYTRSTIQLRKAESLGLEKNIDVKRRLIFNYYQLGDTKKMLQIFHEMIREDMDIITENDMSLAIFYHILYEELSKARTFTSFAIKKFPNNEVFYAYNAWLLLQQEDITEETLIKAEEALQKGLAINNKNPMISLTFGQLEEKRSNIEKAFIYYKQTVSFDKGGEYGKLAKKKLEELELNKK